MDLALYHPNLGYYARAAQRSGRAGDFFTSVDVGPIFGELLAVQIAEMAGLLGCRENGDSSPPSPATFDLVEAGAGNGRLSADIVRAFAGHDPTLLARMRLHLVEASPAARAAQRETLGPLAAHLASSASYLPESFEGVLIANELLDALPVHQLVMRDDGLREVYVEADSTGALTLCDGPLSTPALSAYLLRAGVSIEPGWRADVNLLAVDWIREVARRLARGFVIVIDYGHDARELYSATHSTGTLTTYSGHRASGGGDQAWLQRPGEQDITAHVDFTSVRAAAEEQGLQTLGFLDQSYFLMGIMGANLQNVANVEQPEHLKTRLALKTLLMPGGLGSTMKVLILGKHVGTPALAGLSYRVRVT